MARWHEGAEESAFKPARHSVIRFPWQILTLVFGAVLTSYFVYLGRLRQKGGQSP
jgi:hypothetical protein